MMKFTKRGLGMKLATIMDIIIGRLCTFDVFPTCINKIPMFFSPPSPPTPDIGESHGQNTACISILSGREEGESYNCHVNESNCVECPKDF